MMTEMAGQAAECGSRLSILIRQHPSRQRDKNRIECSRARSESKPSPCFVSMRHNFNNYKAVESHRQLSDLSRHSPDFRAFGAIFRPVEACCNEIWVVAGCADPSRDL